jgi:two-component system sensor histidine kinase HydH
MTAQPSPQYLELAELAGRLIHEIKNHLGTLTLHLQLMAEDLHDPQTPRERRAWQRSQKLLEECRRLTTLSTDFLRFARIEQLSLAPADLKDVIEELTDFYLPSARRANIEIKAFLPANLPTVSLDRELFKQALLNLILNAEQAMPQGGELTIQAERRDQGVTLRLIDTGLGMTPDVLSQIFKPFYSTRPGGSGLGLPTTRRIIEAHGGSIEAHSEPGKGTLFTITLPTDETCSLAVEP